MCPTEVIMHIPEVRLGLLPCIEGVCREESWERGKTTLTWAHMNSTFSSSLKSMLLERRPWTMPGGPQLTMS
jgi:hypothetical protein